MAKKPLNQKRITALLRLEEAFPVLRDAENALMRAIDEGAELPLQQFSAAFAEKEAAVRLLAEAELEEEAMERTAKQAAKRLAAPAVVRRLRKTEVTVNAAPVEETRNAPEALEKANVIEFATPLTPDEMARALEEDQAGVAAIG